ncbi:MAG TPA: hypothetical protein VM537_07045 [Anaerolineae bacterium]|nr:hypothetical protein [Anaerolineae bacterium]
MIRDGYCYRFDDNLPLPEAEKWLLLSVVAAESLYGRSPVRLDAAFCLDRKQRSCVVDATSDVGRAIARIFTGFLTHQFGEVSFRVERVGPQREADLVTSAHASQGG